MGATDGLLNYACKLYITFEGDIMQCNMRLFYSLYHESNYNYRFALVRPTAKITAR